MKSILKRAFRVLGITPIYRMFLRPESALKQLGWTRSIRKNESVDADGQPIPWMTYPMISFLEVRLKRNFSVFEYGAGNSTLWLANRVHAVVSLEHDREWFSTISKCLPAHVACHLVEVTDSRSYGAMSFGDGSEDNAYTRFIDDCTSPFDVIIVDGIHRLSCIRACLKALHPRGVLIIDNTNDPVFSPMRKSLIDVGFSELPFHGMAPIQNWLSCSSVFYRQENCFEI